MGRGRWSVVVVVVPLTSCGAGPATSAACAAGVIFGGRDYVQTARWSKPGHPAGVATVARCEDTQPDGRGLVFTDRGPTRPVRHLPGVATADALAVGSGGTGWVYVSVDLSRAERRDLLRRLR